MPLTEQQAIDKAVELRKSAAAERTVLDDVRRYWTGRQSLPSVIPTSAPIEVKRMARMSRVNICSLVVESLSQSLFVEGFRGRPERDNAAVWDVWQRNRFDARQTGIHRAALAYGTAYARVLPGDPVPVIRGCSPRTLHAVYSPDDPDWPVYALERYSPGAWRLYDDTTVYLLRPKDDTFEFLGSRDHGVGVTPVVRFQETEDLDLEDDVADSAAVAQMAIVNDAGSNVTFTTTSSTAPHGVFAGQVGPLMALQDQIDVITFNLLVAQHYTAFRQRYIIGWTAPDENATLSATAAKLWTFDDPETKVGELSQTELEGYIRAREASLRHAASLSQTPAHELIGELVNLSAEALAAAEAGRDRKVADRQTLFGESHEQVMRLVGRLSGAEVPDSAQVVWRDTSARSLAATVDALGKLVTMLGVPPQELWERIPGVSQQDVERWKAQAATGDAFAQMTAMIERQAATMQEPRGPQGA